MPAEEHNASYCRAIAVSANDGSVVTALPATQAGPQGVTFVGTQVGTWETTGPRSTCRRVLSFPSAFVTASKRRASMIVSRRW